MSISTDDIIHELAYEMACDLVGPNACDFDQTYEECVKRISGSQKGHIYHDGRRWLLVRNGGISEHSTADEALSAWHRVEAG